MWVLVHVTDSIRPTDAFVTYPPSPPVRGIVAATEGMAAAVIEPTDDISRRRHRKAHRLRLSSLVLGKEA